MGVRSTMILSSELDAAGSWSPRAVAFSDDKQAPSCVHCGLAPNSRTAASLLRVQRRVAWVAHRDVYECRNEIGCAMRQGKVVPLRGRT